MFSIEVGRKEKVIAFEPTCYGFERLKRNLSLNPELSNIVLPLKVFLSNETVRNKREKVRSSWKLPIFKYKQKEKFVEENPKAMKLDHYVKKNKINRIDFIKIDVDGFEPNVIKGAIETIKQFRPRLVIEVTYSEEENNELISFFMDIAYQIFNFDAENKRFKFWDSKDKIISYLKESHHGDLLFSPNENSNDIM